MQRVQSPGSGRWSSNHILFRCHDVLLSISLAASHRQHLLKRDDGGINPPPSPCTCPSQHLWSSIGSDICNECVSEYYTTGGNTSFKEYTEPSGDTSKHTKCVRCPDHTTCKAGTDLSNIQVHKGHYRFDSRAKRIYECHSRGCKGSNNFGDQCKEGYEEGPLW